MIRGDCGRGKKASFCALSFIIMQIILSVCLIVEVLFLSGRMYCCKLFVVLNSDWQMLKLASRSGLC